MALGRGDRKYKGRGVMLRPFCFVLDRLWSAQRVDLGGPHLCGCHRDPASPSLGDGRPSFRRADARLLDSRDKHGNEGREVLPASEQGLNPAHKKTPARAPVFFVIQ